MVDLEEWSEQTRAGESLRLDPAVPIFRLSTVTPPYLLDTF